MPDDLTLAERVLGRDMLRLRREEEERAAAVAKSESDAVHAQHDRPRTRADCENGPRPCPWVGCRHHLYLEVKESGTITLTWPDRDPWELEHSCSLDLADQEHGVTLEKVGEILNLTRERIRQLEARAVKILEHFARRLDR